MCKATAARWTGLLSTLRLLPRRGGCVTTDTFCFFSKDETAPDDDD
jgi:hypothetical protein